jgi:hypothetical protein
VAVATLGLQLVTLQAETDSIAADSRRRAHSVQPLFQGPKRGPDQCHKPNIYRNCRCIPAKLRARLMSFRETGLIFLISQPRSGSTMLSSEPYPHHLRAGLLGTIPPPIAVDNRPCNDPVSAHHRCADNH